MTMPLASFLDPYVFRILTAARSNLGREWQCAATTDPFERIYLVTQGACWVAFGGRRRILTKGNLLLIPSHTTLAYGCPGEVQISWLHFTAQDSGGMDLFPRLTGPFTRNAVEDLAAPYFDAILPSRKEDSLEEEMKRRAGLFGLLALLLQGVPTPAAVNPEILIRFKPAFDLIQRELGGDLSVPRLAGLVGLSSAGFTRAFIRHFGEGPARWILRRKIARARELMAQEALPSRALAERLGFVDEFHFAKTFRRVVGRTPKAYRESLGRPMP
jgi:AraC family transcriptional regulator